VTTAPTSHQTTSMTLEIHTHNEVFWQGEARALNQLTMLQEGRKCGHILQWDQTRKHRSAAGTLSYRNQQR